MIGLDTNVLARYIMQDDAKQSPKATKFMESLTAGAPGFVSLNRWSSWAGCCRSPMG